MEKEFLEWYKEKENRFYQSHLDAKEVAYAAWIEAKEQRLETGQVDAVVIGSLPDDESIDDKACEYIDEKIYINTGEGHDTCREWAFADGAKWMRDLLSNDQ